MKESLWRGWTSHRSFCACEEAASLHRSQIDLALLSRVEALSSAVEHNTRAEEHVMSAALEEFFAAAGLELSELDTILDDCHATAYQDVEGIARVTLLD